MSRLKVSERCDEDMTITSSMYQAECESVTTHEDDPRISGTTDPSVVRQRGPKPSSAALRAKANDKKELEKKAKGDRLLGHEYGEKPLLLDDELDGEEFEDDKSIPKESIESPEFRNRCETLVEILSPDNPPLQPPPLFSSEDCVSDDDVFAMAPFQIPKLGDSSIKPPCSVKPPSHSFSVLPDATKRPTSLLVGLPSRLSIFYHEKCSSEFERLEEVEDVVNDPIYENCSFSESMNVDCGPRSVSSQNNPFTNPFVSSNEPLATSNAINSPIVSSMSMSVGCIESPESSRLLKKSNPLSSTDMFGSTPFNLLGYDKDTSSTTVIHDKGNIGMPSSKSSRNGLDGSSPQPTVRPKPSHFYSPPAETSVPYHNMTSTPTQSSKDREDSDDEDMFGSIPFKPSLLPNKSMFNLKCRTLPANMSSNFQQLKNTSFNEDTSNSKQMEHKEHKTFKAPKITPPSFRKSRLSHKILSSGSETEDVIEDIEMSAFITSSSKKSKNRETSKDRLKYKNIKDEFEEENTMVLPMKQFGLTKKDKTSKKAKKLEKVVLEKVDTKKHDKKWAKLDKKSDKKDKKQQPQQQVELTNDELSTGISNMSFEDDHRSRFKKENLLRDSTDDSEEALDLRVAANSKFGSLKRGINPFSKLGNRI